MPYKTYLSISLLVLTGLVGLFLSDSAKSFVLNTTTLTEDFSTIEYADFTSSTGLWNIVDSVAQAAVFANGSTTRPLNFGNGFDGSIDTRDGFTFDTNNHPNGYDFINVNILGGNVYVTGANPLIIRALGYVNIVPTISVKGGDGQNGFTGTSALQQGPDGGNPVTCRYKGGRGGAASGTTGYDAVDAFQADGTVEAGTGGSGATGAGAATAANASATGPGADFDTGGGFICGTAGAGGGGHSDGAGTFATGGAGGAGGGALRIISVGSIQMGTVDASGGAGGLGVNDGTNCSGHGAGGGGGAVWLQTFHSLVANSPTLNGGNGGAGGGCGLGPGNSVAGIARGDSSTVNDRPAWASGAGHYDTVNAVANQTYYIQSKPYDLGTLNVYFTQPPEISKSLNGGEAIVRWAASKDGITFTNFKDEIRDFNNSLYRYVKFQIQINTASAAGPSPMVSKIKLNYADIGAKSIDLKLTSTGFLGCGSLIDSDKKFNDDPTGLANFIFWISLHLLAYGAVRKTRRGKIISFPARSLP